MRSKLRAGFTIIEILIALAILVICFIPVSTLLRTSSTQTAFNDYYVVAHIRATRILDIFSSYSFDELTAMNSEATHGHLVQVGANEPALPPEYEIKLAEGSYAEKFYFTPIEAGLGKLEVVIRWRFRGAGEEFKSYKLEKLVHKRDLSLYAEVPL